MYGDNTKKNVEIQYEYFKSHCYSLCICETMKTVLVFLSCSENKCFDINTIKVMLMFFKY